MRTESAHLGGDEVLDAAADEIGRRLGHDRPNVDGMLQAVVPAQYRAGDTVLSFFSTIAQFGTAEDIALAELKIEMMFPADEATRIALRALGEDTAGARRRN